MSKQVRQNDLDYYSSRIDADGPAMTYSMEVISRLDLGQFDKAVQAFPRAYANYKVTKINIYIHVLNYTIIRNLLECGLKVLRAAL